MKCPECKNELDQYADSCECGWERGPGGRKVGIRDGERNLQTWESRTMGFRIKWAQQHGMYKDGGMPYWEHE